MPKAHGQMITLEGNNRAGHFDPFTYKWVDWGYV